MLPVIVTALKERREETLAFKLSILSVEVCCAPAINTTLLLLNSNDKPSDIAKPSFV